MPWTKKAVLIIAFYLRLPVIALSLGRNAYTLRLRHQVSDAGLDSAIVTIWLEVQLAYPLAASTLSALKAFTGSLNSGFGLGFTRRKSDDGSYALSAMSRSVIGTGSSIASRKKPETLANDTTSPPAIMHRVADDKFPSIVKTSYSPSLRPLRLRPDLTNSRSDATATAKSEDSREKGIESSRGPLSASDSLVILRETQLSITRDLAPEYVDE